MQGKDCVIEKLEEALLLELAAVNQYWLHARLLENWGYVHLAKKEAEESMEERLHADRLMKRMIFLEAQPDVRSMAPLRIGDSIKRVLEFDLLGEMDARNAYQEARRVCSENADYVSMKIFEDLLFDEEKHIDFIETQLNLINTIGEERYAYLQAYAKE